MFLFAQAMFAAALQSASPAPTASPSTEIGHVYTSDRTEEPAHATERTTFVVGRGEILRHNYRSIADAIEHLPGVNVVRYGSIGSLASIGIRGSTSNQVLVLIDGLPAAGAQTGTLDLNNISTSGVERIEVVEGGGSTLYGSRAVGGIINILTKPQSGPVYLDAQVGSFGNRALRLQTKNFSFERVVAANNFGYLGGTETNADAASTGARFAFERDFGALHAEFSGGIAAHQVGANGGLFFFSPTSRQAGVDRDIQLTLTKEHARSKTTLQLGGASQQFLFTCNTTVDPDCPNSPFPFPGPAPTAPPFASVQKEGSVNASFRNVVAFDAQNQLIYGIDLAHGVARIDDGLGDPIAVHGFAQTAAYVQNTWNWLGENRLYAGIRAERDGAQGGSFSPSVGANIVLGPNASVKLNYATAFRAPTAVDLYYPGFSNPNLQPERTQNADLSLVVPQMLGGATITWFTTQGNNLIALDSTFTPQNIEHASIAGITADVRTRPLHGVYTRTSLTDLYLAQNDVTNTRISGAGPVFSVSEELGYLGEPGNFIESAGVTARTQGARSFGFGSAPVYTRADAFVRMRLGSQALLALRVQNLGNEAIQDIPGYPQPGRAVILEISTR